MRRPLLLCLVLITLCSGAFAAERRVAVIIGNGAYKADPLRNTVNDAEDMAKVLITRMKADGVI